MSEGLPRLDGHALRALGREVPPRFEIDVCLGGADRRLICGDHRRLLPGRRLVTESRLDGRPVLLKFFYGAAAAHDAQRELEGAAYLQASGVDTPVCHGRGDCAGGRVVAFDLVAHAAPLPLASLPLAAAALARLHASALVHADPKADNFLVAPGREGVICVDGGAIRARGGPPPRRVRLEQLARLAAQFGLEGRSWLETMSSAYRRASDDAAEDLPTIDLEATFDRALRVRAEAYARKCVRDCSEFRVESDSHRFVSCRRARWQALAELLDDPDRAMADGTPLKRGRSASVVRVQVAGDDVVIKRYSPGSVARRLRTLVGHGRALRAWRNGHLLQLLGVRTPAPVAIVVARRGPMFGAAWLVMELAEGVRLDRADPLEHVDAIVTLFGQLARAGLVHGDTKASNFVVTPRGLVLLDLDAMRSPRSRTMRRRGQRQDVERFLANWPARSPLGEAFERARLG